MKIWLWMTLALGCKSHAPEPEPTHGSAARAVVAIDAHVDAKPIWLDEVDHFAYCAAPAKFGGAWGYVDSHGAWIVTPRFDSAGPLDGGAAWAHGSDGWHVIDPHGAISRAFGGHDRFRGGYATVADGSATIVVDTRGRTVATAHGEAQAVFDDCPLWLATSCVVRPNADCVPATIQQRGEIRIVVANGSGVGAIGCTGTIDVPLTYAAVELEPDGLAWARDRATQLWALVGSGGRVLVPPTFASVDDFAGGVAKVHADDKVGLVDRNGRVVAPTWADACCGGDGLYGVFDGSNWGFVDGSGNVAIAPAYRSVGAFGSGIAPVELDDKWGYIDRTGKLVVPADYDTAEAIDADGLATATRGKAHACIAAHGGKPIVRKTTFAAIHEVNRGFATTGDGFGCAYVTPDCKEHATFAACGSFGSDGYAVVGENVCGFSNGSCKMAQIDTAMHVLRESSWLQRRGEIIVEREGSAMHLVAPAVRIDNWVPLVDAIGSGYFAASRGSGWRFYTSDGSAVDVLPP